ncbi:HU family DNA-binding protein [Acidithiobacillus sp. HP-6]|jgi:DNA-binding protein HU-beta|uniref:HU family DNA-binding protein n=1 Tax=Acidithiobacillus sulfurivorans TaxID=1958756 RepID=A0ABS5ZY33_9PROT|nr:MULTISPECIES: HU family DNA-binding protein [Acidithiobacillus]MBE7562274.1 HU family DNA-binding protein [Acidithiobacillus sp. HP-6]MBE7568999.1 HU family DNA-binding protein [Acidithiobacillus sp. HP-2]MBU2759604.1 HU family DNA-binding protein [Acidithiobacillus sulfurivorans]MDD5279389.1 HU family DNA-binding protein [Acidithiobacillus sp.]
MNKSELIEKIAEEAGVTRAAAGHTLDAAIKVVTAALKEGDQVTLVGFGSFLVSEREARKGRNPATGAEIMISASRTPKFKAGKALRDAVN